MKKLLFFLCAFPLSACAQVTYQAHNLPVFSGMVDVVAPDKLKDSFSPDCLNVITDELGCLTKRTGYQEYNTAALEGPLSIKRLFTFRKTDGSNYIIVNSSHSMFANTSGGSTFSAIKGGLGVAWIDDYAVANDVLIRCNGYSDYGGEWDGTTYTPFTVSNSTLPTAGKYIEFWHNRYWVCGSSMNPNVLFYSEINNPKDIEPLNYINISKNDGDSITGLIKWADRLLVTKSYETFEVLENSAGSFILRLVSPKIGCLYSGTYDELDGLPIWLSARGVERFNGSSFELISASIDNTVKALPQLTSSIGSEVWDTAADWGAGSGVRVDTTTSAGSVKMTAGLNLINQQNVYTGGGLMLSQSQTFRSSYTIILTTISIRGSRSAPGTTSPTLFLTDNSGAIISSATIIKTSFPLYSTYDWATFNFSTATITLTAEATYYIYIQNSAAPASDFIAWDYSGNGVDRYTRGGRGGGSGTGVSDMLFKVCGLHTSAGQYSQYQSSVFSGTSIKQWSSLALTQIIPAGTSLQWFISPATAAALCTTTNIFPVDSPSYIITMSSPVPYAMLVASMSTQDIGATPVIDKVTLNYIKDTFGTPLQEPCGITYEDRYYLFVSTDLSTNINNVALVYQKDGSWTRFNDIFARSACTYLGKLYTGDAQDTGKIYETFVPDLYTDRGIGYAAYWKSKYFNMGSYFLEKLYADLWATSDGEKNGFSVDYALDGSATWKTLTFTLGGGVDVQRMPFPHATKGRLLQYKVYNNTAGENFSLKQLDTIYGGLAPR